MLKEKDIPKILDTKISSKCMGIVKSYGANTHQGIIRNYNEDRVAVILNMVKPQKKQVNNWPQCSFFAVYDGHGGSWVADQLRDNLHTYIVNDENFPDNPKQAILKGCEKMENDILYKQEKGYDRSGSCAIIALIVEQTCFIANVGDSRAILSSELGKQIMDLSTDHKPGQKDEMKRIKQKGGNIYQSEIPVYKPGNIRPQIVKGPYRVLPGRLSVSRTFGDPESKIKKLGGTPGIISAVPEIFQFEIDDNYDDFLFLGCDGIFDKMHSSQAIDFIWEVAKNQQSQQINLNKFENIHNFVGFGVKNCLKQALKRKSFDNVTILVIAFQNLFKQFNQNNDSNNQNSDKN